MVFDWLAQITTAEHTYLLLKNRLRQRPIYLATILTSDIVGDFLCLQHSVAVPASSSGDVETSMEVTTNER